MICTSFAIVHGSKNPVLYGQEDFQISYLDWLDSVSGSGFMHHRACRTLRRAFEVKSSSLWTFSVE